MTAEDAPSPVPTILSRIMADRATLEEVERAATLSRLDALASQAGVPPGDDSVDDAPIDHYEASIRLSALCAAVSVSDGGGCAQD